ncbi:uncharacterized protein [Miscanthus floridulus]
MVDGIASCGVYAAPLSVLLLDVLFVALLLLLLARSKEEKRWKTRAEDRGERRGLTGFLRCGAAENCPKVAIYIQPTTWYSYQSTTEILIEQCSKASNAYETGS